MQAILKFNNYCVEYMNYKRNSNFWDELNSENQQVKEVDIAPEFSFDILLAPGSYLQANVIVGVKVGSEENSNSPFRVEAVLRGFFEITTGSIERDRALKFYSENAIAILYPYLRSLVSDLTGKSDHQPLVLPTLNIIKIAQEYLKHKKSEEEKNFEYHYLVD